MSYIITDDKHYKNIANSIRSKMQTDREYYPEDMAIAIDNIPSSADETDNPVTGIYFTSPDGEGKPTKAKISGWSLGNKETPFPIVFTDTFLFKITNIEFINCDFKNFNNGAFLNCLSLTTITLPNTLTSIGEQTFLNCSSLTTINFPNTLKSIGWRSFRNCSRLATITLPNTLTAINNEAFRECSRLSIVNLENGFNCGIDLSASTLYTRETILQWLNALADRTGQTAYKLTIGATNLAKLTEQDILIATNKNWTLA